MRILAFEAHPADAFDSAAGTMANHAQRGDDVFVISLTHGVYSHAKSWFDESHVHDMRGEASNAERLKREELANAGRVVGCRKTRCLGLDDEPLIVTAEVIKQIAEIIRELRPDIVLSHHPSDFGHPDHAEAGKAVLRAVWASSRWLKGSSHPRYTPRQIYFYGVQFRPLQALLGYSPVPRSVVIDITKSIGVKEEAMNCFHTQYTPDFNRRRIEALEGYHGMVNGTTYAEEFIALNPVVGEFLT